MDKKIIAVAVVAIIIVAAVGIYFVMDDDNDVTDGNGLKTTLISRVNTEGSGMFAAVGLNLATTDANGNVTFNKENWDQKVFLTPGPSTIQHVQLMQIVNDLGYKWVQYTVNTQKESGNVYWVQMSTAGMVSDFTQNTIYDGGFIWEPVYTQALMNTARAAESVLLTNDYDPEHTCCVVSANTKYLVGHSDEVTAFLAGYTKAVDWVNDALSNKTDIGVIEKTMDGATVLEEKGKYGYLVWLAMNKANMSQAVVEEALSHVTYTYSNDGRSLTDLETDVQKLVESFVSMGQSVINKPLSGTGYDTAADFAKAFVDDSYLEASESFNKDVDATIRVAVIGGDIHQIAIHVADSLNFFDEYGLTVKIDTAANGPGVSNLLLSGEADLGFLGAPPASINTINFA